MSPKVQVMNQVNVQVINQVINQVNNARGFCKIVYNRSHNGA